MGINLIKEAAATAQAKTGLTQYQTIITSGKHAIVVDEPESVKGGDTAIDPLSLLAASLASCTSITLRMYIDRKMWAVSEITVDAEVFKVESGTLIERRIHFKGELNDEQRKRLTQIADACPIHKILIGNIMIDTKMA